nr:zinc finger protein 431-like isoform X1 [Nothobranchius furzeri]
MLDSLVFNSEVKSILETMIGTAVDVLGSLKEDVSERKLAKTRGPDFNSVVGMLVREVTRKISDIFSQLSLLLLSENSALKARVGQLDAELKTVAESLENAQMWRENVLKGCPVLFEESGIIFTLKPFGKLTIKTGHVSEGGAESSPAAPQEEDQDLTQQQDVEHLGLYGLSSPSDEATEELSSQSTEPKAVEGFAATDAVQPGNNEGESVVKKSKGNVFVCEVCSKNFYRQFHLMKHMNTHQEQRPFACDQCPRKFRNAETFEHHLLRHEEKKHAAFKCQLCEKSFKTKMCLKSHQLVHTDTRAFSCSTCRKAFKTKHNLQAHQVVHLAEKPHKCIECGRSFRYAIGLQCHQSVHTGEHPYKCTVCGKAFTSRRSFRTHQAVHRGKVFTCETCGAGFTLQQNLRRHSRIHTGEKPFSCRVCGKRFMQDNKLKAHMLLHGAKKMFMCDQCGKTFLYNCQLKKHQEVAHSEEKVFRRRAHERGSRRVIYRRDKTTVDVTPFSCSICHKGFDTAGSLKRHELIHKADMQYTCDKCNKSFFYKATYKYHLLIHSGEKPFACDVCGKRFLIFQALKSHKLQHSGEKPHKCEQCGKDFRTYTNYLRHLRIHTGEKPYECEVCGVRFRQLAHVKFHMQVHTGERPYSCSSCGLRFSDSRLLKKHNCSEKMLGEPDQNVLKTSGQLQG